MDSKKIWIDQEGCSHALSAVISDYGEIYAQTKQIKATLPWSGVWLWAGNDIFIGYALLWLNPAVNVEKVGQCSYPTCLPCLGNIIAIDF